ncbi:unnamed protein product, partial [Rotaria magnacalcarata]
REQQQRSRPPQQQQQSRPQQQSRQQQQSRPHQQQRSRPRPQQPLRLRLQQSHPQQQQQQQQLRRHRQHPQQQLRQHPQQQQQLRRHRQRPQQQQLQLHPQQQQLPRHPQQQQLRRHQLLRCKHFVSNSWIWNNTAITVAGNGSSGTGANQLNQPWNIFIDQATSDIYIADSLNNRVVKWLPNATSGIVIAGTGNASPASSDLNTPRDVFADSTGNIYVADSGNQRVQFFRNGSTVGTTVSTSWGCGNLFGVYVYNSKIYGCDITKSVIWANGTGVAGIQIAGSASNQLNQPQGFTIDTLYNKSTLYVANSMQHTVVQFFAGSSTGTIVAGINGVQSSASNGLNFPVAVKLDSLANVFIVDNNNHRIQLYCRYPFVNTTGRTIAGTGVLGTSATQLYYPAGVALDSSMNLYVADTSNHRVQKFMRIA